MRFCILIDFFIGICIVIIVVFFYLYFDYKMIEWCYQGDDPKFIENHYKGVDDSENEVRRKTADALVGNLGKECFCGLKSEDKNIKNFDAKDAKYFINL